MKNRLYFLIEVFLVFLLLIGIEFLLTQQVKYLYIETYLIVSLVVTLTSFLYKSKIQYYKYFLLYFLIFISVLYVKKTSGVCTADDIKCIIAFYAGIANIGLLVSSLLNKKIKAFGYLFSFVLLIPTIFIWQYFFISNGFASADTLLAILQTNFSEAKGYVHDFVGIKQIVGFVILLFVSFVLIKFSNRLKIGNINNKIILLLIITLCLNLFVVYKYRDNIVTKVVKNMKMYIEEYEKFKRMSERRNVEGIIFDNTQTINKGIYVLVIGESQTKTHMSAYGYDKQTTPWLDSMEQDKNFIKFTNVYGCHTQTAQVLSYALTSKNQYNSFPVYNSVSILDIAKALDINTVWLSNQNRFCLYDNIVSVISDSAQQQKWINRSFEGKNKNNDTETIFYDIALVDALKQITIYDDMLIIIHLMGNHTVYKDRYPKEFDIFKDEQNNKIAEYDNSILYNDYVVENIFKTVKDMPNFKALIYFADHGEAVDTDFGHDSTRFVLDMTKVPMYIYFSDDYIKDNSAIFSGLCNHKDYFFTNDLFFNLLLGIWNAKIPGVYEQNNDILSQYYNNNINRFRSLHGKKTIADIAAFLKANNVFPTTYTNKRKITIPKGSVWLHMVNSRDKLERFFNDCDGFEMDINYNDQKKYFNVSRNNINGNENLADMLKDIDGLDQKYLWFDFKNLSDKNKKITLDALNKIAEENGLKKEKIIVESKDPISLELFSNAGYYTSFDLDCYKWGDIERARYLISDNIEKLKQSKVDFVSSDAKYFDVVKYCFPSMPHLFWIDEATMKPKMSADYIFKNDNNTYVVIE